MRNNLLQEWWNKVRAKDMPPVDGMNRATFRQSGLQGRKHSQLVTRKKGIKDLDESEYQQWVGQPKGRFLEAQGRHRIWFPHVLSKAFRSASVLRRNRYLREASRVEGLLRKHNLEQARYDLAQQIAAKEGTDGTSASS